MTTDPRSVAGKRLEIAERTQILVVGAGPAGIAAARHAHQGGAQVMLVDEHPVPFETMGESVPQIWGGRMGGAVRNRNAMTERMLEARPDLVELFDLGIDIRLSTACWGLFANQPNLGWMPGLVAGLVDEEQGSHLVGFDQAVVATGRRDMGLAFPGWDLPGVLGAGAALMLARLYDALDSRRA
ncbi:FAD-dependent oxidoreductase, partial [Paracoccus sp. PXZ]